MTKIECANGHIYDSDSYSSCPYCMPSEYKIAVCPDCGSKWIEGDRYCRYCGARKRTAKLVNPDFSAIYGPVPIERLHKCEKCGYKWTTSLMLDGEKFCPKCGGKAPAIEAFDNDDRT